MNIYRKKKKLLLGLSVLLIVSLMMGALPGNALAGGGGEDICQKDGGMETVVMSGSDVRLTFRAHRAPLRGPGSTVALVGTPTDGVHTHVIIWVVLHHDKPADQYTVRVINVVTGCNG